MFDTSRPNIILLTDQTDPLLMAKMFGVSKAAAALRLAGFEVAVINHLHIFSVDEIKNLLAKLITSQTLFIGTSPFVYKNIETQVAPEQAHEQGGVKYGPKEWGSFLPHGLHYNREIQDFVNAINPNCKFVLGGPDAQDRDYARDYDYVVVGYGDDSVVDLARHLAYKTPLPNSRRSLHGPVLVDDREALGYDFANTPMSYQSHDAVMPGETLMTEIARGCIFQCGFCSYPLNGKKKLDFIKNEEILYQEFLENYEKWGVTRYIFVDDTYNDSDRKLEMMSRISKRLPFDLEYWASMRLDLLTAKRSQIDQLYESGCRGYMFGIETLYEKTGKIVGKGGSREKLIDTINYIKEKYGNSVMLHGSFIFGLPEEPVESMKDTARRLTQGEIKLDSYVFHAFRLMHPGNSYTSKFDREPEKYGYTVLEDTTAFGGNRRLWENKYTNYLACEELTRELMDSAAFKNMSTRINGTSSFFIAGLGYDLSITANKLVTDVDWHQIDLRKQQQARAYKELLYSELGIAGAVDNASVDIKSNNDIIDHIREYDQLNKP